MIRRLIAFLVAFLLACSGASAVARALAPDGSEVSAVAQAMDHQQSKGTPAQSGDAHGLVHPCDCGDDGASDAALLAPIWPELDTPVPRAAPAERPGAVLPTPFLEGLKRPPRR